MKIASSQRLVGSILVIMTLFIVGGCGYKNEPVAPNRIVPKAIEDLQYTIDEKGVKLTWSYPIETIKGTDIVDIDSFDLYRAVIPLQDYCKNCPIPFGDPIEVPGGVTTEEERRIATYESSLLRPGHKYFFKVRSRNSWWASSADSNIVSFVWNVPVKAVDSVTVRGGDSSIMLSWSPVTSYIDDSPVDGPVKYQILRSLGGKGFEKIGDPIGTTTYTDRNVAAAKKYFYKIQSIMEFDGNVISGGISDSFSAMAVDRTPPDAPTGVTAVRTGKGIKVFWNRIDDAENYRIYRRKADEGALKMIGEVKGIYTIFEDTTASEDISYFYSVTAVDRAQPGNESAKSAEATIRH